MTKQGLIGLIEGYKGKALEKVYEDARATAITLMTPEALAMLDELNVLSQKLHDAQVNAAVAFRHTAAWDAMTKINKYASEPVSEWRREDVDLKGWVIGRVASTIASYGAGEKKRSEIKDKFDKAISAVKACRSQSRLTEIAKEIGIPVDESGVVVEKPEKPTVDLEYVREKIQQVKALT